MMSRICLVLLFALFISCHKDDKQVLLKENTMYIAATVTRNAQLRIFTQDGEIHNQALIDSFYDQYPDFFLKNNATQAFSDTIRIVKNNEAILRREGGYYGFNVGYDGDHIKFTMVDSIVTQVMDLEPYFTWSFSYIRDSTLKNILDMEFYRRDRLIPWSNGVAGFPILKYNEKAVLKDGKIIHPVSYCYCRNYTSSGFSIAMFTKLFGIKAQPGGTFNIRDTIVIQEGTVEYTPI